MDLFPRKDAETAEAPYARKMTWSETRSLIDPLYTSIAHLSDLDVEQMNREELISLVTYSNLCGVIVHGNVRLEIIDHSHLKQVAALTRDACRRNVDSAFQKYGRRCA